MSVHPIIRRVLSRAYQRGHHELPKQSLAEIRRYYEKTELPQLTLLNNEDIEVSGAKIRLHRPSEMLKPLPVIIYLRASAYTLGKIEDADYFGHYLAKYLKCVVATIEPRRAPEYKFPIPFNDCVACIKYLFNHHVTLRINAKKMAIWGESSGGNFAAAACQHLKEEKINLISQQILFYPMLDYYQHDIYPSKRDFAKGYLMDQSLTDWFVAQYVTQWDECQDKRISPLLADNFENLPQTLIIGAQYDPMRDEGSAYIDKLLKSGVYIRGLFLPGMIHGFLWYTSKLEAPRFAQRFAADFLKERFLDG